MSTKSRSINQLVPSWAAGIYLVCAAVIVPWTVYLGETLPARHVFRHWDIAWTGLDGGLILSLLLTAIFAFRKSIWVVLPAVSTGSLLVVDAWFDVISARTGRPLHQALIGALLIELPIALASYRLAYVIIKRTTCPTD